jgi:hypothetical protein
MGDLRHKEVDYERRVRGLLFDRLPHGGALRPLHLWHRLNGACKGRGRRRVHDDPNPTGRQRVDEGHQNVVLGDSWDCVRHVRQGPRARCEHTR